MAQDLVKQVKELEDLDVAQLQARYEELHGKPTISRNKKVLLEQIKRRLHTNDIAAQREQRAKGTGVATDAPPSTIACLTALTGMNLAQLREEFERVWGKPSLSRNRKLLIKRIAEKIQAEVATEPTAVPGAIPQVTLVATFERQPKTRSRRVTKATAKRKSKVKPLGARDPRLPKPGTVIEREWRGKKYLVRVMQPGLGFEFEGKPYRSLSALAKHITGQIVNGFAWRGLGLPAKESRKS